MKIFVSSVLFFLFSVNIFAQSKIPATEIRAVWLTTNWGLDWPTRAGTVDQQKNELRSILNQLQDLHINTIMFQARAQGRAFYNSKYQAKSPLYNHSDGFDPLAFAIEECHLRGMECHAWLIAFPVESRIKKKIGNGKRQKIVFVDEKKPANYKAFEGTWYLDPGHPDTEKQLVDIAREIVENYDVDGIHFDYIRYPSNKRIFPDDDTYRKYGNGMNIYDWRRDNINRIVAKIYDTTKSIKKWVQVSSSPLGRYRVLPEIAPNDGWTGYETVFQDAGYWLQSGKHDLVLPMMYYRNRNFEPFLDDWVKNSGGRPVVPGIGVYQMMSNEQNWPISDIESQVNYVRNTGVKGQAYFRAGNIINNLKGLSDTLKIYYPTPAKLLPMKWLDNEAPNSPILTEVYKDQYGNLHVQWDAPDHQEDYTYTVYFSYKDGFDTDDANQILTTGLRSNSYSFPIREGEFGCYYTVTASDRFHNESVPCVSAYFVHSADVK